MQNFFEVLILSSLGAALLFGVTLFFRKNRKSPQNHSREKDRTGSPTASAGGPPDGGSAKTKTCPVCSGTLKIDEPVHSMAFPALNGSTDRLMHIRGCFYCLRGDRDRVCPACKIILKDDEILICRLFDRPGQRIHVHVLGCSQCRGPRKR